MCVVSVQVGGFLSTLSLRRATRERASIKPILCISIHALLAESDGTLLPMYRLKSGFLSTLSLRRATSPPDFRYLDNIISIHALLAESDGVHYDNYNLHCVISIHALLAESDLSLVMRTALILLFLSTLSLRRATPPYNLMIYQPKKFLSTLSLRRATSAPRITPTASRNFYPRSPCGERQANAVDQILPGHISIHALLAESDAIDK